jgi:hypothetical protein
MKSKMIWVGTLVLLFALVLTGCQDTGPGTPANDTPGVSPTQMVCPTPGACPECPTCPEGPEVEVPFFEQWVASPHNDAEGEAFVHWNDEGEVPADCAKCHSTPGYLDWLGEDGTEFRVVDNAHETGTTITCTACHNQTAATTRSVLFPSGVEVALGDASSTCARCHQGRASKIDVDNRIEAAGLTDQPDQVSEELGFINIHYYAAAATLYGSVVHGGYEYAGEEYEVKFDHVEGFNTCIGCHNPHTTELRIEACAQCHEGVSSAEDFRGVRMLGSMFDYDGDGDVEEGMYDEIVGLQEKLLSGIQAYGTDVAGTGIGYNSAAYPYWFIDTDNSGVIEEGEAAFPNAFKSWTPRLLKAAYNYQVSLKDPGAYAHNGKYIIQLLHDSIADLNESLAEAIDIAEADRLDAGHFAGSQLPFRYWDNSETGLVPSDCVKCHTAHGLPFFLANNRVTITMAPTSGLSCATCHDDVSTFTRRTVEQVTFPSGARVSFDDADSNVCLECHQGRTSKLTIDQRIMQAGVGADEVSETLAFANPHYFAAGATHFGTEARGAYEYDGKQYNGRFVHVQPFNTCIECHDAHNLEIRTASCSQCHGDVALEDIRMDQGTPVDYDGDGDTTEGIAHEIETMHQALLEAIQAYATEQGNPVAFGSNFPYWFNDNDGDGQVSGDEGARANAFATWTPDLLRAAYNYTWVAKDPGTYAHNPDYVLQFLYDSLESIGSVQGMTRPAVTGQP